MTAVKMKVIHKLLKNKSMNSVKVIPNTSNIVATSKFYWYIVRGSSFFIEGRSFG